MNIYLDFAPHVTEALPGKGGTTAKFMLVGMAPSTSRPRDRRIEPFGAKSWEIIQSIVRAVGEHNVYITNLVKTPVPAREKLGAKRIREWRPCLDREIELVNPSRILCLGDEVAKALIPGFGGMRSDHGTFFPGEDGRTYVPCHHFSAAARNPGLKPVLANDLKRFFTLEVMDVTVASMVTEVHEIPKMSGEVVIDIETGGLLISDPIHFIGVQLEDQRAFILHSNDGAISAEKIRQLGTRLQNECERVVGHNIKFDLSMLVAHDLFPSSSPWSNLETVDTMLLAHNSGRESALSLKHLVSMYTSLPGSHAGGGFHDPLYLTYDLVGTRAIFQEFRKQYETYSGKLMSDMSGILGAMRARGVYLDRRTLQEIHGTLRQDVEHLEGELLQVADINWGSNAQVAQALRSNGVPLYERTKKGAYSVAEAILRELEEEYPLVQQLLEYRTSSKLYTGFVLPYLEQQSEYIYPDLRLHGTETGRLSCTNPNLQQIPRVGTFKTIFKPRWEEGYYGLIDLSQAELRVVALLCEDEKFIEALLAEDAHRAIAAQVFGKSQNTVTAAERKQSKGVTFGLLYGGSPHGLAHRIGIPVKRVEKILSSFFKTFPKLQKWLKEKEVWVESAPDPLLMCTPFGRTRDLTTVRKLEGTRRAYRQATNTDPQSGASDIMLDICRTTWRELHRRNLRSRPLFLVHDSTLLEIYPGEQDDVADVVDYAFKQLWSTPLRDYRLFEELPMVGEVVIARNWAEVESTNEHYNKIATYPVTSTR